MKVKKLLAGVISAAVVIGAMTVSAFAEDVADPDLTGTIVNVTKANAQDVLDGKYGDINGKTINFTENITETLDLARPTKYQGSGTAYYQFNGADKTEIQWSENISSELNALKTGTIHYYRTLKNVTFTANDGVTVKGFNYSAGHVYTNGSHDYVRDIDLIQGQTSYYRHSSMDSITFVGLTFTYNFDAALYMTDCEVKNITFENCVFNGADEYKPTVAAIHMGADDQYFVNTIVNNCKINNYFQGVYIRGIDSAAITGNIISNTTHNALGLQSYKNDLKGRVTVEENYLSNVGDRAIRINNVSATGDITINNNIMVKCGDSNGQLIKATSCTEGSSVNLESNYWDGKGVTTAVAGLTAPTTTGITGGTWNSIDADTLKGYLANGATLKANENGSYTVTKTTTPEILEKSLYVTYKDLIKYDLAGNGQEKDSIKLTLFAGIDSLDYSSVGFDVTVGDTTKRLPIDTVYESVKTIYEGSEKTFYPSDFGSGVKYIFGWSIHFPAEAKYANASATWTPFAIKNGEEIRGAKFKLDDIFLGTLNTNPTEVTK